MYVHNKYQTDDMLRFADGIQYVFFNWDNMGKYETIEELRRGCRETVILLSYETLVFFCENNLGILSFLLKPELAMKMNKNDYYFFYC